MPDSAPGSGGAGPAAPATFPEALRPPHLHRPVTGSDRPAVRRGREHLLDVGRIHAAFVTDTRARGKACGPLGPLCPKLPAGDGGVSEAAR